MTITTLNDVSARGDFVATSGQTAFPLAFKFFASTDLQVYVNGVLKALTTDYTVAGANADTGMQVTFTSGRTLNDAVSIVRVVPYDRTSQLPTSGPFNVAALNTYLTRIAAMLQQLRDSIGRTLTLQLSDVNGASAYDAQLNRIKNLGTPINPADAVTKGYADSTYGGTTSAVSAAASATAAAGSASSAASSATAAAASAASINTSTFALKAGCNFTGQVTATQLASYDDYSQVLSVGRYSVGYGGAAITTSAGSTFMSMQVAAAEIFRFASGGITLASGKSFTFGDGSVQTTAAVASTGKALLGTNSYSSGAPSASFTSIALGTHKDLELIIEPTSSTVNTQAFQIEISNDNGSTWEAVTVSATNSLGISSASYGVLRITAAGEASTNKIITGTGSSSAGFFTFVGRFSVKIGVINAIRITPTSGNFGTASSFRLYAVN